MAQIDSKQHAASPSVNKDAGSSDAGIRLIVPFPPGGSTDFTAREFARELGHRFDSAPQVETCAGDFGIDAMRALMQGPHELVFLVGNINANSVLPVIQPHRFDFDYKMSIRPVSRLAEFPSVIMTHADFPADTLSDFLRHLQRNAARIRYGTDFLGTFVDYDALMLGRAAGLDVAYHNTSGALGILEDLQADRIDLAMLNVATATANRGTYKPLAVTGPVRLANFPDVPTMSEAGFSGIGTSNWQGLFASGGASAEVVASMHEAVKAFDSETTRDAFAAIDARVATSPSPDVFAGEIEAEMEEWRNNAGAILALPQAQPES